MWRELRAAASLLAAFTVLTGVVYPLAVTLLAQVTFVHQANGSLLREGDRIVGSELIGQSYSDPRYFWGRMSATAPTPYNATASGGSNLGPLHPDRARLAKERVAQMHEAGDRNEPIPVDLVTASASGLDPHISPAAAEFQTPRVARARNLPEVAVRRAIARCTQSRQWGLLGEPRVNVLQLNLALDRLEQAE